jgi:hypothetical protein
MLEMILMRKKTHYEKHHCIFFPHRKHEESCTGHTKRHEPFSVPFRDVDDKVEKLRNPLPINGLQDAMGQIIQ